MSSVFGQPQSKPSLSLFANSPASAAPGQSNLFGNTQAQASQQPQQQPLNFGNLGGGPQSKPSGNSIFGQTKATSASGAGGGIGGGGGLFAQSPTSQQPPPQQPLGGGLLFGNSQAQQKDSQPAGNSLFGVPAQSTQNQNLGGLGLQAQQAPEQSGAQNGGPVSAFHSGCFNTLLEKGRKRGRTDEAAGFGDVPSLQLGLGDIAKRVRELGAAGGQTQGARAVDSKAHYLLAASGINPGTTLRDLGSLNALHTAAPTVQAPSDWDPDSHRYVEQLQQQSTLKMIEEGIARAHRNFDAYLEENVDINWDVQRKKIFEHFGLVPKGLDDASDSTPGGTGSFGRSTRRGRKGRTDVQGKGTPTRSVFGNSGMQKSVIGTPGVGAGNATLFADVTEKKGPQPPVQEDRFTREKQGKFAERVQRLNHARLEGRVFPIFQELASVESQPGAEAPSQLIDAYRALIAISKENNDATDTTDPNAVKERAFADEYLDETPNSIKSMKMRKRIIDGSRRSLEEAFFNQLDSLVSRNPREANLGGVPSTLNKVRAYIRIRSSRKDLVPDNLNLQMLEDDYCWALIFFLLRSGFVTEAAEYVTDNATAFRSLDRNFITYITSYASSPDRRLPRPQQDRINAEYQQRSRIAPENSVDPYRMASYKIIGRCELSKRSLDSVSQGVEDWIWLQFNLAREVNRVEESAGEVFGLEELRETIREIGQRHFIKGSEGAGGFGTYFFLQILAGLFEHAVSYLYSYSYVSAVHFAIALDFYGLLRVSDFSVSEGELLTYNTKQLPQLNFGRMIGYYTRDFRSGNAEAAVDYLALICLNADLPGSLGKSQSSLCHEALRELVLETREFALLLGDVRSDGTRIKGVIELRLKLIGLADQEEFLRTVTLQAASVADDNGRTTDAVLLYHLCEDYDNVISIINRALSDSIAVELGEEQLRLQTLKPRSASLQTQQQQQPQQLPDGSSLSLTSVDDPAILARNMITLYNANALYYQKIRTINRDTVGVLLRLSEAKSKVEAGLWAEALDIITSLSLLPLTANSSIPLIRSSASQLSSLPTTLSRLLGPLLLMTITCISKQRDILSGVGARGQSKGGSGGRGRGSGNRDTAGANELGIYDTDTRRQMRDNLTQQARDLMVFAGLVKLRLGNGVWEGLVGVGEGVGLGGGY